MQLWLIPTLPFAGFLINGLFGRRFPKALINAVANLPNYVAPGGGSANYINLNPAVNDTRDDEIKVDHLFNPKWRLMAEYLDDRQTNGNPNPAELSAPWTSHRDVPITQNQLAQIQLNTTISPSMVNTIGISMNNYVVSKRGNSKLAPTSTVAFTAY